MQSQSNENAPNMQPNPASDFEYQIDPNENVATIVRFLNYQATVCVVPAEIKGNRVVKIGANAFSYCDALQAITLPDGLKTIGDYAFYNCQALQIIAFQGSRPRFGDRAFNGCRAVRVVASPNGQTGIPNLGCAYERLTLDELRARTVDGVLFSADGKTLLACLEPKTEYVVPDGVETIADGAFQNCQTLQTVNFGDALQTIGDRAFQNCQALQAVNFGDALQNISESAFRDCRALQTLNFGDALQNIGDYAFYDCQALQTITLPDGLERVGDYAFYRCKALRSTTFGDALQHVGKEAFYDCQALISATFRGETPDFGEKAFSGCQALRFVASPSGQTKLPGYNCPRLTLEEASARTVDGVLFSADGKTLLACLESKTEYVVPDGVEAIADKAFFRGKTLRSITLPNSLKTIGDRAFHSCKSLQAVALPDGIRKIPNSAFAGCDALRFVASPNGRVKILGRDAERLTLADFRAQTVDGVLFSADGKTLLALLEAKTEYVVPDGVASIADLAFSGCESLRSVAFPQGLESVGVRSFYRCKNLSSVAFRVGLQSVAKEAFAECESLHSVALPNDLRLLAAQAFSRCARDFTLYDASNAVLEKRGCETRVRFEREESSDY